MQPGTGLELKLGPVRSFRCIDCLCTLFKRVFIYLIQCKRRTCKSEITMISCPTHSCTMLHRLLKTTNNSKFLIHIRNTWWESTSIKIDHYLTKCKFYYAYLFKTCILCKHLQENKLWYEKNTYWLYGILTHHHTQSWPCSKNSPARRRFCVFAAPACQKN